MKVKEKCMKGLALLLAIALLSGMIPFVHHNVSNALAAGEIQEDMGSLPSQTYFATKSDLMTKFDLDGAGSELVGKIFFGKNMAGEEQEWYLIGPDAQIAGDNVVCFAAIPIAPERAKVGQSPYMPFSTNASNRKYVYESDTGYGAGTGEIDVYSSHYGASDLRKQLQELEADEEYFSAAEQNLMNATTVSTYDKRNDLDYKTTDKLYALDGVYSYHDIYAGTDSNLSISVWELQRYETTEDLVNGGKGIYNRNQYVRFWLRSASQAYNGANDANLAYPQRGDITPIATSDITGGVVRPAFDLDLSSVFFASAVKTSGEMAEGTPMPAMTLRLDGSDQAIGDAIYGIDSLKAQKADEAPGAVRVIVQGKDTASGTEWCYCKELGDDSSFITVEDIQEELGLTFDFSFVNCQIWLETTPDDGMTYAKMATQVTAIDSVAITDITPPVGGQDLDRTALCGTEGVATTEPTVTYTDKDGNEITEEKVRWNTQYKASMTLSTKDSELFRARVTVLVNGKAIEGKVKTNKDGTLTVICDFTTAKEKVLVVSAPIVPDDNTFTNYYTAETVLDNEENREFGTTAKVSMERGGEPIDMAVEWTLNGSYNSVPGTENTYTWTILPSEYADYDTNFNEMSGTVTIKNKAATPVHITGTDGGLKYTGVSIDVASYFEIDENAGSPAIYSLESGSGEGTINGTVLTVTKTGTFTIKVETPAVGNYAAGEATATLTVEDGVITYEATDYSGTYDGQPHGITVAVTDPADTRITYSTDGATYSQSTLQFTDKGEHTVYYKIEKQNYQSVTGSATVTITAKDLTVTTEDQTIVWGQEIHQQKYTVQGLAAGDTEEITLTPSTSDVTEDGTITADIKIKNAADRDVTDNYEIACTNGKLVIIHDTSLAPISLMVSKAKTSYYSGDILNVDDLTVKAGYADGYEEELTPADYTTNASAIDMSTIGTKPLTVSYTKNGGTVTGSVNIIVEGRVITYEATDYSGIYDGQPHGITVAVTDPADTKITYSTDGEIYSQSTLQFTDKGEHTVYYKIEKQNYQSVTGSATVTITAKDLTVTIEDQTIVWGQEIHRQEYAVQGLAAGDEEEITLIPSTSNVTEDGTITADIKIKNAAGRDVTDNYEIAYTNGKLVIIRDTSLAPISLTVSKTKTSYYLGDILNVDDLTVKAGYAAGYEEELTSDDYTTNASAIDMSAIGTKPLTVSYTKNGGTVTGSVNIIVEEKPTESVKPTKPTESVKPTKPEEPTKPTKPEESTEPTKPTKPVKPTESVKPTKPEEPTESIKPTKPEDMTESVKPTKPIGPTEPAELTESTEPGSDNGHYSDNPDNKADAEGIQTGDENNQNFLYLLLVLSACIVIGARKIRSQQF